MPSLNRRWVIIDPEVGKIDFKVRADADGEFERQYRASRQVSDALRITGRTSLPTSVGQ